VAKPYRHWKDQLTTITALSKTEVIIYLFAN